MPIPSPNKGEKRKDFFSRCMGNGTMVKDFPKQDVRGGVCGTAWDTAKKKNQQEGGTDEMTIPKPKKGELKETFISRCMGNHIMLTDFPDDSDRGEVCNVAWGETNKTNKLTTLNFHANFHAIRREVKNDIEYIVAPVVAIVEGVHHGSTGREYYPALEIDKSVEAWEGMPLTIDHPKDNEKRVISYDPEIAEKYLVGEFCNVFGESGKLKGEVWIDITRAKRLSPEILAIVEAGNPLEVSTGLYAIGDGISGNWKGEEFDNTLSDFRPDHLALLPNDIGACSIGDGCGVHMNTKNECKGCKLNINNKEEEGGEKNVKKDWKIAAKTKEQDNNGYIHLEALDVNNVIKSLKEEGFKVLELSHGKVREQLHRALNEMDKPGTMRFLREVFDDFFIFEFIHENENPKLFKQGYSINNEDELKFKGDPTEVREKLEFIELTSNLNTNNEEHNMKRTEQIQALIVNKLIPYNEGDNEALEALSDEKFTELVTLGDKLAKCQCDKEGNIIGNKEEEDNDEELKTLKERAEKAEEELATLKETAGKTEEELKIMNEAKKAEEDKKPPTFDEVLATAKDSTRESINNGIKMYDEKKDSLVKILIANKGNKFTEEDLNKKPMDELEMLISLAGSSVDFSGKGEATKRIGNKKDPHERTKDNKGVPKVAVMKWNKDGTPDLSHLSK